MISNRLVVKALRRKYFKYLNSNFFFFLSVRDTFNDVSKVSQLKIIIKIPDPTSLYTHIQTHAASFTKSRKGQIKGKGGRRVRNTE